MATAARDEGEQGKFNPPVLAWLSLLSPPLASYLSPYSMAAGLLGEGSVMLWLLVISVNVQRWKEQASVAERR